MLGALLAGQGRYDEAEAAFVRTLKAWTRLRGPDHYEVAISSQHLGALHAAQGDVHRARDEYRDALRIKFNAFGPFHPEVVALTADCDEIDRRCRSPKGPPADGS